MKTKSTNARLFVGGIVAIIFVCGICHAQLHAQSFAPVEISNFTAPITDRRGGETIVRGAKGKQVAPGIYELTGIVVETFRDGEKDLIIEAAQCLFDQKGAFVTSENELTVQAANERFRIAGKGFRWQGSDSRLVVSNSVQTVLRKRYFDSKTTRSSDQTNPTAVAGSSDEETSSAGTLSSAASDERIEIQSNRMEMEAGTAVFGGQVRARDPSTGVACDSLTATFGESVDALERIVAEGSVVIHSNEFRGNADKAIYSLKEETITLTGNAAWNAAGKEGTAQAIIVDKRVNEVQARENVWVKLAPEDIVPLQLFPEDSSSSEARPDPAPVEIRADHLRHKSNEVFIRGNIRIQSGPQRVFRCETFEAVFAESDGRLTEFRAAGAVRFEQGEASVFGNRADFSGSRNSMTITGSPGWRIDQGHGTSDRIVFDPTDGRLIAEGNVDMTFSQVGDRLPDLSFGSRRNPGIGDDAEAKLSIRVGAHKMYFREGSAIFLGEVRAVLPSDSTKHLRCGVLAAFFNSPGNSLDQLVAEDGVRVLQADLEAYGQKVVHSIATGVTVLTGDSKIIMGDSEYVADEFRLERSGSLARLRGDYRIKISRSELEKRGNGDD